MIKLLYLRPSKIRGDGQIVQPSLAAQADKTATLALPQGLPTKRIFKGWLSNATKLLRARRDMIASAGGSTTCEN
jgi:hypothetical protein